MRGSDNAGDDGAVPSALAGLRASEQREDPTKPMSGKTPNVNAAPAVPKVHLTERAARRIRELLAKEGVAAEEGGLRLGVQGGGCSGLSYAMRLEKEPRERDNIFEEFGARIFVDPRSLEYLKGTTLEYEETLIRQGFVFQNPNASRSCGCGTSFTV